jgi:hypothetical protein
VTFSAHHDLRAWSGRAAVLSAVCLCLLALPSANAQGIGKVECARPGDYVYLYSSMVTMDIRTTLQCGQEVEITGRYGNYFAVRTAKGEVGYVPLDSLSLLKTTPGQKASLSQPSAPARERILYDSPGSAAAPSKSLTSAQTLLLLDSTPIHMKIGKTISSADARVGDEVHFTVSEDVVVGGFLLIAKGSSADGVVNEAEPRKALGRGGKLSVIIQRVRLADNQTVGLRSDTEGKGSNSTAGVVVPLMRGKNVTFPQGMEFTAYVNGDTKLARANFQLAESAPSSGSAPTNPKP